MLSMHFLLFDNFLLKFDRFFVRTHKKVLIQRRLPHQSIQIYLIIKLHFPLLLLRLKPLFRQLSHLIRQIKFNLKRRQILHRILLQLILHRLPEVLKVLLLILLCHKSLCHFEGNSCNLIWYLVYQV